jgi:branched-subunit amino acid ABC-type transport system permease component
VLAVSGNVVESSLIIGIFTGTIYALMALGMVASFRINRVVNLGIPGLAVFGATVYFRVSTVWGAPIIVALLGGIIVGAAFGAVLGLCSLKMSSWPRGIVMIFTLTATLFLFGWSDRLLPASIVSPQSLFGSGGFRFSLTFVSNHQIGTFLATVAITVLGAWVVSRTRAGLYVRAIYDDGDSAATLGIPTGFFVVGVWAVAGALAALAGILISPRVTLDPLLLLFVSIWALAGSILGGLESFGVGFVGSLLVGVSQGVLGAGVFGHLGPGVENLGAVAVVAAAVFYAGTKRRDLAHIQT